MRHQVPGVLLAVWFGWVLALPAAAAERLPIFDGHMHYSNDAWRDFSPTDVVTRMNAAGVVGALVSSTPDDGTLKLLARFPDIVVPELRPYRDGVSSSNWHEDSATPGYLKTRLGQRRYVGIGEFHLNAVSDIARDTVQQVVAAAVARGIHLHVHADAPVVEALLEVNPEVRILWAHAGMVTPPEIIRRVMDRHPGVAADLAYREDDINGVGVIDPAWRRLLLDFPDRFVVGSDTWAPGRWPVYGSIIEDHRAYLRQLPRGVAEKIAHRNAARMFRGK